MPPSTKKTDLQELKELLEDVLSQSRDNPDHCLQLAVMSEQMQTTTNNLKELSIIVMGDATSLGLKGQVAQHNKDLARFEKLLWIVVGAVVTLGAEVVFNIHIF